MFVAQCSSLIINKPRRGEMFINERQIYCILGGSKS